MNSYWITVRVTDNGQPQRSATTTFNVTVSENPLAPRIAIASLNADEILVSWNAVVGRTYRVQFKNSLADPDWTGLPSDLTADSELMFKLDVIAGLRQERYYRLLLIE